MTLLVVGLLGNWLSSGVVADDWTGDTLAIRWRGQGVWYCRLALPKFRERSERGDMASNLYVAVQNSPLVDGGVATDKGCRGTPF